MGLGMMNTIIWKKQKIGEIAIINMGQSPESKYYNDKKIGLPFLQGNRTFGSKYPTFDTFCSNGSKFADPNDILMSVRAPVGDLNITKERIYLGRGLASLKMKNGNYEYLFYLLKANVQGLVNRESGTVFGSINKDDIYNFEVLVAQSDDDQRRIADILSALDDKIELNRQTNATLEAIAQAIFKEWFVDFNFPGATGELVESELGMIPKGWRVGNIEDFGDIVCGKTPSKTNENFFGGNIPFIKIPDMHNSVYIVETSDTLTYEGAMSQKNKFLPPNSIIVSCIATIGLVSLTAEISQTNQQINAIIPKRDNLTQYIYFTARNLKNQLIEMGSGGSTTLNVNTANFSNIKCVIPSEFTLSSFDFLVKPLFEKILANQKEILTIAQCRDSLLPKLMNGEIEV